jgi:hypothetical protein
VGLHGYEQALRAFRNQIIQRQLRETKVTLPWCRIGDMNGSYVFVHGKLLHRGAGARDEMNVLSWRTFSDVRVEICKDLTSRCALYMYSRLLPCLYLLYYDLESATGALVSSVPQQANLFPRADLSARLGIIVLDTEAWQCFSTSTPLEEEQTLAPRIR